LQHIPIKRFCTLHPSLLTQRRWPKQRLEFCEKVIFAPKHAELIDGREAKREREAFREQEERERKEEQATQMALPQIKSKTGCNAAVDRTQSNGRKYDDCV
jgi:hypothetical protein